MSWAIRLSFMLMVIAPFSVLALYLFVFASDRFVVSVGMSVRAEEGGESSPFLDGLSGFSGGVKPDAAIVQEFISSPDLIQRLSERFNLSGMLSPLKFDPVYAQNPDTFVGLAKRWSRLIHPSMDSRSGLLTLSVATFSANDAEILAYAILEETKSMLSRLSAGMNKETTRLARDELVRAELRLKKARRNLTEFRASTRIVDPSADLEGQLGLIAILQEQMAEAQIALKLLRADGPRLIHAERRVSVVSSLLEEERRKFGLTEAGYAEMTGAFEDLQVEVEYAQESYLLARSALDVAMKAAQSKSRYLAVHIRPVRPETPELPRKGRTLFIGFVALFLIWAISVLAVQGFRDRL